MNLTYYRNFVLATETGNLTKAAKIAHVAQPALTHQIRVLEEEFGTRLFESGRGRHQLRLTDTGWTLYRRAKQLCQIEDETVAEMSESMSGTNAVLSFSMASPRVPVFVSRYVEPFTKMHPDIRYDIRETFHLATLDDVLHGNSEIGITNIAIPDAYHFDVLFSHPEHYYIVGHEDNPWLDLSEPIESMAALRDMPLIILQGHQRIIESTFLDEGIVPFIRARVGTIATCLEFAARNIGLALISLGGPCALAHDLKFVPIKMERLTTSMLMLKLKGHRLTKAMGEFVDMYIEMEKHKNNADFE